MGYFAAGAGVFTALLVSIYSWRLIFKTFHGSYNNTKQPPEIVHESPMVMIIPLIILAIGSILGGILFKDLIIGQESSYVFWKSSIKFLDPLSIDHPPIWFIILTPALVIISIPISFYLFVKNKNVTKVLIEQNRPFYLFLKNKWYFDEFYEFIFIKPLKFLGYFFWKKVDGSIIDKFGPDGISKIIKNFFY